MADDTFSSDSSDDDLILVLAAAYARKKKKEKRKIRWWVRPWIGRREQHGAYHALMAELEAEDPQGYKNLVRMTPEHFHELLRAVGPLIEKQATRMRRSISAGERLAVTLRFLASGDSYQSLSFFYRLGRTTIGEIVPETCTAIVKALKDKYLKVPSTAVEWEMVAAAFEDKWNFPHCIGAMDGKHVAIKAPPRSGSAFYNYKEFFSIVLLAIVDALGCFIWYDIGANGRNNDAGIWRCTELCRRFENQEIDLPAPRKLTDGTDFSVPFVIVGDEAFPLKTNLMKPYPRRSVNADPLKVIFNYRLSRARRVSECAFGMLVNRWKVLSHDMYLTPDKASTVTEACVALHNFLRTNMDRKYIQEVKGKVVKWYLDNEEERPVFYTGNRSAGNAMRVRDELRDYFFSDAGQVSWQWQELMKC